MGNHPLTWNNAVHSDDDASRVINSGPVDIEDEDDVGMSLTLVKSEDRVIVPDVDDDREDEDDPELDRPEDLEDLWNIRVMTLNGGDVDVGDTSSSLSLESRFVVNNVSSTKSSSPKPVSRNGTATKNVSRFTVTSMKTMTLSTTSRRGRHNDGTVPPRRREFYENYHEGRTSWNDVGVLLVLTTATFGS